MLIAVMVVCMCILSAALVYAVVLYAEAKGHVDTAPKQTMLVCDKHGAIPESAAMDIQFGDRLEFQYDNGVKTRDKVPYCPRCFEDRIAEAKQRYADGK